MRERTESCYRLYVVHCPDGKIRRYPFREKQQAEEEARRASVECYRGSALEHAQGRCGGGTHVVEGRRF
jgi:hypothetical protein